MDREEIMQDCPEDFVDRLKEIVDYIESRVNEIKEKLDINSTADLDNINDALDFAEKLANDLY